MAMGISMGIGIPSGVLSSGANVNNNLVFTVQSDNVGTSNDNQFTIPTSGSGYLYDISTDDGYTATGVTGNHTITFPSGVGVHTVTISAELGGFPKFYFNNGGDRLKMMDISNFGIYGYGLTSQQFAFRGCSLLTVSATDIGHFENVNNFRFIFENTSVSTLPLIDTSAVTTFETAFKGCNFITFPSLDLSSSTSFEKTWQSNTNLVNFPANMFDNSSATNYTNAFNSTNLSQTSIDNILVSIDVSGTTNGSFKQSGGSAPSSTGLAAINSLVAKGWTVIYTN
jgi:hypothetical protein